MSNIGQGVAGALAEGCKREKTWDERDADERIALLRRELRFLIDRNADLQRRVDVLERHDHSPLGQVTVPLVTNGNLNHPLGYRPRNPLD